MKKIIMIMIAIFLLVCININCFAEVTPIASKEKTLPTVDASAATVTTKATSAVTPTPSIVTKPVEPTSTASSTQIPKSINKYIINNIYTTMMNFQGENTNWKVSLVVEDVLTKEGTNKQQTRLKLVPKNLGVYWLACTIYTNTGTATESFWQVFQNPVEIVTDKAIPKADEDIVVRIQSRYSWQKDDFIVLKNILPEGTISLSEAVDIMVNKHFDIYGKYPDESFTYKVEMVDGNWLFTYDDNDNIGGETYMEINGKSGKVEGVKQDE